MSSLRLISIALFVSAELCLAQTTQAAQTDLYFPHLVDGGPAGAQWQTRFTLINPSATAVTAAVSLYADSGAPLALDLGSGPQSQFTVVIPANGTAFACRRGSFA